MANVFNDNATGGGYGGYAAPAYAAAPSIAVVPGAAGVVPGAGFGEGGLLGTLLLLGLLGGNGLGNNRKDCVDQSSINGLQNGINTNEILSKLGQIEAAIPYNEAQVQLALAGLSDQLTRTITNGQTALMQGQAALQLAEATSTAAIQSNISTSTQNVLSGQCAINTNIDRTGMTIVNAIRDDGNATRALITENVIQGLRDDKVILSNELAELRGERNRDRDRHGLEITMIQNQNQQQLQWQENRTEFDRLRGLIFDTVQSVRATNQAINIGAGTQTSAPVNTNTNVKA